LAAAFDGYSCRMSERVIIIIIIIIVVNLSASDADSVLNADERRASVGTTADSDIGELS